MTWILLWWFLIGQSSLDQLKTSTGEAPLWTGGGVKEAGLWVTSLMESSCPLVGAYTHYTAQCFIWTWCKPSLYIQTSLLFTLCIYNSCYCTNSILAHSSFCAYCFIDHLYWYKSSWTLLLLPFMVRCWTVFCCYGTFCNLRWTIH